MARGRRKKVKCWFYDYETVRWEETRLCVVQSDEGDEEVFWGPDGAARVGAMQQREGGTWVAHGGGIFDHLISWRDSAYPREVILTGSSVLKATGTPVAGRAPLTWRDSQPRWNAPLAKVGAALGAPKGDVDREHIESVPADELLKYCRRDVEILRRGWAEQDAWLSEFGVSASTSGAAAVKLLEVMDPDAWQAMSHHLVDPAVATGMAASDVDIDAFMGHPSGSMSGALDAVRGGRTEVRRIGRVNGPVHVYDIHSSYPAQYRKGPLPIGCVPSVSTDLDEWGWLDWCSWTEPRHADARRTAYELGHDGRGVGELSAWCTWETAHALLARGYNVRRHGIGWEPTATVARFAQPFVDELFRLKESGGLRSFFAKVTVNSLHGKLSEKPYRWSYKLMSPPPPGSALTGAWLQHYDPAPAYLKPAAYHQPLMAAAVYQRARLQLADAIRAVEDAGFEFYYTDTDSVHTNCPPDVFAQLASVGPGLGQWGHEGCAGAATYLAPKVYQLHDLPKGHKVAGKGLPLKQLTPAVFDHVGGGGEVKLTRTGLGKLRAGPDAGRRVEQVRTLRRVHHGRILLDDGVLRYA